MALKIGELWAQLWLDNKEFDSKLEAAGQKAGGFASKMNQVGGTLTKSVTLPLVAAGGAAFAAMQKTGAWAEELENLSASTGLSKTRLQEFKFVADQTGLSFEAITNSSLMLQRKLQGIEEGTGPAAAAMQQLGVSVTDSDGKFRSMDEMMPEVISKLQGVSNETERNVLMSQLFGRSCGELIPLVAMGADGFNKLTKEAHASGNVLGQDALEGAQKFDDALDKLTGRLQGFTTAAIGGFLALPGAVQGAIVALAGLIALVGPLMKVAAAISAIRNSMLLAQVAAWATSGAFTAMWAAITGPVGIVIAALAAVAAAIYAIVKYWDKIKGFFGKLIPGGAAPKAPTPAAAASGAGSGGGGASPPTVKLDPETTAAIRKTAKNTQPQPRYA